MTREFYTLRVLIGTYLHTKMLDRIYQIFNGKGLGENSIKLMVLNKPGCSEINKKTMFVCQTEQKFIDFLFINRLLTNIYIHDIINYFKQKANKHSKIHSFSNSFFSEPFQTDIQ